MNILLIGGGTGSTVVLEGLKRHKDLNLSVIVGMADDGGSNAVVRDEFGLLPLSDIRKSILALYDSGNNEVLRKLFLYRFAVGNGIKGHTLGNLLMIAMTDILGSEMDAIAMFKTIFGINGDVIPVTLEQSKLVAKYDDGTIVEGEHLIDEPEDDKLIVEISLKPSVKATQEAIRAIEKADFIILGPGDVFTTTLVNVIVGGIKGALKEAKGKIIYITNLTSKKGQTLGRTQRECLNIIEKYIGRDVDYALINNAKLPEKIFEKYVAKGQLLIEDDIVDSDVTCRVIRTDLVGTKPIKKDKGDELERSLIRHDSEKLSKELYKIFTSDRMRIVSLVRTFLSYYKN